MPRIITVNDDIKQVLPNSQRIITFADNGAGDDLLFDYRNNEEEPAIVFMKHDQVNDPEDFDEEELAEKSLEELLECNIHHVCNSFDELLDMLYPEDFD
ncbi:SMI1/KNR4 family protein [Clostridium sp. JS66]|uniref:SMI1/KNR4 family protein n=1 Tax=Clostridium sp. JS66 TaxID=3064705 RepID=UPI00298E6541|nr:SMI1/KNR4 family protein [Clostridium sp. JS66]WPC42640.1 hypothetical protein Q6H37_03990 [Clostridium sp. JS66]